MNIPQKIAQLLYRHLSGTISEAETEELNEWVNTSPDRQLFFGEVNDNEELAKTISLMHPEQWNQVDAGMKQKIQEGIHKLEQEEQLQAIPVHRVHLLKRTWWKYAAAVIIIAGAGAYLWKVQQKEKPSVTQTNPVPVQNDVAPGGNRATLTLADGSTINLDSASNGVIAKEGNTSIRKKNGSIEYDSRLTTDDSRLSYNTMTTPRGGQYQLQLPDGTQVWLNAESSITYPTIFSGKERRVTIKGEAYFEVAKDKLKKFIVSVAGDGRRERADATAYEKQGLQIEVLGTHFNVNAYPEEPSISTTLLEGSVRLTTHGSRLTAHDSLTADGSRLPTADSRLPKSLTLSPGQQGQLAGNTLSLAAKPDIEQVIAWKNGAFNFQKVELSAALKQISRWYDVEIIYTSRLPDIRLYGGMGRDLNLSEVLKVLEGLGVKTKLEGKKLYISE